MGQLGRLTKQQLKDAMLHESAQFEEYYLWLENHMPPNFFEEIEQSQLMLIAHNLVNFPVQDCFIQILSKESAIVITLNKPKTDLKILKQFSLYGIKNYQTYTSDAPPPFEGIEDKMVIALIHFTEIEETECHVEEILQSERRNEIYNSIKERNPSLTREDFEDLLSSMNTRFLRSLTQERLVLALEMFLRARTRDHCQYEVRYNEDWASKGPRTPSIQIVLAWRNAPKHRFLYRLAKVVHRHGLILTRMNASYVKPYSQNSILMMSIGLHGQKGGAAWEEANIHDFLQELATLKYFDDLDNIDAVFVDPGLVRGNLGNFIRSMHSFVHQFLLHADLNLYSHANVEEGLCRHPELTVQLCRAFEEKFHPVNFNVEAYEKTKKDFLEKVEQLDTGHQINDSRRKNILKAGLAFIEYTDKTNFYRNNKSALSFRINPGYLETAPYVRKEKFPELPYCIFFVRGLAFVGFHIRFQDISRGGLRTVIPQRLEQMIVERSNVFSECYNLSYTQEKKNKDIPEGGSKGVIFINHFEKLEFETKIYQHELTAAKVPKEEMQKLLSEYRDSQRVKFLYQAQRAYVHSILTLVNCHDDGTLKARDVVDYYQQPEYLYLGPDENMHNSMIEWIAEYSKRTNYKPKGAFISSKPTAGINHKEYGVTSFGVNVNMHEVLLHLGIDPTKDPFTIKITGGPDGDVAGNQMLNLLKYYPDTAKLLAVTDGSGTIYDPEGLDLHTLADLFHATKAIHRYPPEKLNEGGLLLDLYSKREETAYAQQTLCYHKENGKIVENWLSGNEMNHLYRHNVHQVPADIFIPGGGRPRTLNKANYTDFLDPEGRPTARAIIEAANLYLTLDARYALEELGVLIIKDSSANKGGVICSSLEVQIGLTLSDEEFLHQKDAFMKQVLDFIRQKAQDEARLMLKTFSETDLSLIDISDLVSQKINTFTYEILNFLKDKELSSDPKDPLIQCLLRFCLPLLSEKFENRIIKEMPDMHKKAIISCYIASKLVYKRGLNWSPSIADILPVIVHDPTLLN
ncbi:MAG: NAD-glutamate dehydrogenase [Simkaniaceae bacterium]|nr:NAD-glutamate dehydrogenase [Simkaniaceae bacterium]